ncbi:MAG: arginine--tRNA ligase [candidate division NC10 bacterium]|nr:arginine--tRNA ligase [candidate division NC10 bacterium]
MERLKQHLREQLLSALARVRAEQGWPVAELPEMNWEYPPEARFGDLSTPLCFALAKQLRRKPRDIASALQAAFRPDPSVVDRVEVAGAGYLNLFVAKSWWQAVAGEVLAAGRAYGRADLGQGRRVQVEFVSANPTGPLHVGHGRGAALGDAIASLLQAMGYRVEREFYINDAGTQVRLLGESVWARYREARGEQVVFPENGYHGEYVREVAARLAETVPALASLTAEQAVGLCAEEGARILLEEVRADLRAFGVGFDTWFSEKSLFQNGEIERALATLRAGGYLYEDGQAIGFRASEFGDEKDRILIRSTGEPTYFTSDIAYHANKIRRGFQRLINIWGADHGGYIPRVKAAIHALGHDPEILQVILLQMVRVLRGGQPVPMSKRSGQFVELREVVSEVGKDAARFLFLTRRSESQLDFDIEVAKKQSMENPVYYVQYAHARSCSMAKKAEEAGILGPFAGADLSRLTLPEELAILKQLAIYPELVAGAAQACEPHRLTAFLQELAAMFHGYFTRYKDSEERVISEDRELSHARLAMVAAVRQVVANGLGLLGVAAPERM